MDDDERMLRTLALTPGRENFLQAVRLVAADQTRARRTAAMLAQGHPAEPLASTAPGELRACLAHELVLRDAAVTASPPRTHRLAGCR